MLFDFHLFSKLPTEIRLNIWKLHLHVSRQIEFAPWHTSDKTDHKYRGGGSPTLLRVNQESRRESRNFYGRFFGDIEHQTTHDRVACHDSHKHDGIYINPSIDVIQLSFHTIVDSWLYRNAHDLQYMKHLEIGMHDLEPANGDHQSSSTLYGLTWELISNLKAWTGLESLKVTISHIYPSDETLTDITSDFAFTLEQAVLRNEIQLFPEVTVVIKETGKPIAIRHRSFPQAKSFDWTIMDVKKSFTPWVVQYR